MLELHVPEYQGLLKVISGGQDGADEGGLIGAKLMGLPTGGTAPKNFRTDRGPRPDQAERYGLVEHTSYAYPPRTLVNVRDSDGTLIIACNPNSPGCALTQKYCKENGKPFKILKADRDRSWAEEDLWMMKSIEEAAEWLKEHNIRVLNVAGNRDKLGPRDRFHEVTAKYIVSFLIAEVNDLPLPSMEALNELQ